MENQESVNVQAPDILIHFWKERVKGETFRRLKYYIVDL